MTDEKVMETLKNLRSVAIGYMNGRTDLAWEWTEAVRIANQAIKDVAKMREAVGKIKDEIKAVREDYDFINIEYALSIIDKHTEGLEGEIQQINRTPQNCSLIAKMGDTETNYPHRTNERCQGYSKSNKDDEPCEECKECKYNEFYEE